MMARVYSLVSFITRLPVITIVSTRACLYCVSPQRAWLHIHFVRRHVDVILALARRLLN